MYISPVSDTNSGFVMPAWLVEHTKKETYVANVIVDSTELDVEYMYQASFFSKKGKLKVPYICFVNVFLFACMCACVSVVVTG